MNYKIIIIPLFVFMFHGFAFANPDCTTALTSETQLNKQLFEAVKAGNLTDVTRFISQGAEVNATNRVNSTPLHVAIQNGHYAIVEFLIEMGADVNAKNSFGNAPLHIAVSHRQTEIIELFLRKQAQGLDIDFDIRNDQNQTPVELAEAKKEKPVIIIKLLTYEFTPRDRFPTELDKRILEASKTGDMAEVQRIVEQDPDVVHARTQKWNTPLHVAIQNRHYDIVEFLIEKGADVNAKNRNGNTPLHVAVSHRQTEIIELFLRKKAQGLDIDFDVRNDQNQTPVELARALKSRPIIIIKLLTHEFTPRDRFPTELDKGILEASKTGDIAEVRRLIKEDSDVVHARTNIWGTPLHVAIQNGHYDIVEFLIKRGADVNAKNMNGNTPLHVAVGQARTESIELFLRKKAQGLDIDFDIRNDQNQTPVELAEAKKEKPVIIIKLLTYEFTPRDRFPTELDKGILEASKTGDMAEVQRIVEQDPDVVHARTQKWNTPLHVAIQNGHYDIVEFLIERGADVNAKNVNGNTPLHVAVMKGLTISVKLLVENNAKVDIRNDEGKTPVKIAEEKNSSKIEDFLKYRGELKTKKIPLTWLDKELIRAVESGDLGETRSLIENQDANVYIRTHIGKSTLLHLASKGGYYDVVEFLIDKAPDLLNAKSNHLNTPLHVAIQNRHYATTEFLIERGADVNAKNRNGNTPLHVAVGQARTEIIELFLRKKAQGLDIDFDIKNDQNQTPVELARDRKPRPVIIIIKLLTYEFEPRDRFPTELDKGILEASETGDIAEVRKLIKEDPDVVHARTDNWGTPLHVAIQNGHYAIVEFLIERGADVNAKNGNGNTPLHVAVNNNKTEIIELFLRKKAQGLDIDFDIKNDQNQTPVELAIAQKPRPVIIIIKLLTYEFTPRDRFPTESDGRILEASKTGDISEVRRLIKKDPDVVHARTDNWGTPLHVAIQYRHNAIVEFLIERGADVNAKNGNGNTPLHVAVMKGLTISVKLLVENNAKVDIRNDEGKTPVKIAEEKNRGKIADFLKNGGELKTRKTPLTWLDKELIRAVESGNLGETRNLIENQDANVYIRTHRGKSTLLHLASKGGYYDVVQFLIDKAPDLLNAKNNYLNTPLHVAIQYRHNAIVEFLIEKGADVNAKNVNGNTPLHVAVGQARTDIIELFLRKKAQGLDIDFDIKNDQNQTPVELARTKKPRPIIIIKLLTHEFTPRDRFPTELDKGILEVSKTGDIAEVRRLVEQDPDVVHARTDNWGTPLHVAIHNGHYDIAEFLIERGADVNAKNVNGNTPLHIAVSRNQTEIIELFLRKKAQGLDIDFDIKNDQNQTPVELARDRKPRPVIIIIKLLTYEFEPRDRFPTELDKGILEASETGDIAEVRKLIKEDPDVVHARTDNWGTPLHVAIQNGHYATIEFLIERGADVNAKNSFGNTPLHSAVRYSLYKAIDKLLTIEELIIGAVNDDGETALDLALDIEDEVSFDLLVDKT